ncbi:MAG: hypothetical protein A3J79_09540 [Elusimicrobia bacterium RIFOXYB2_FULL_62_6]|nr:MAG: hypothetical protein A3J79_09540 [Elusimicrobia bacterium RIFOXYB2_FULL_62_6]
MSIDFDCPYCGKQLSTDDSAAGQQAACPECGKQLAVPGAAAPVPPPPAVPPAAAGEAVIFCAKCGQKNGDNNYQCTGCGAVLHAAPRPARTVKEDNTLGGLIPLNNKKALLAYYFGIFSLIPCLGIPLGVAALVLGLKGLAFADANPEAKGKGHAWTGIILGGGCALVNLLVLAAMLLIPRK